MGGVREITDPLWESGDGETPLSLEARKGLIPKHITVRRELNDAEREGLDRAVNWAYRRTLSVETLISPDFNFMCLLHKQIFGDVWGWAGSYRLHDVGVVPTRYYEIRPELLRLHDDAESWQRYGHPPDEIAVRFHHRSVLIHPFPDGNGRLTRLMADLLARSLDRDPFTWGRTSSSARVQYLAALKAADNGDIGPLLALSRQP